MATNSNMPKPPTMQNNQQPDDLEAILGAADQLGGVANQLMQHATGLATAVGAIRRSFEQLANLGDPVRQAMEKIAKGGDQAAAGAGGGRRNVLNEPIENQQAVLRQAAQMQGQNYKNAAGHEMPMGIAGISRQMDIPANQLATLIRRAEQGQAAFVDVAGAFKALRGQNLEKQGTFYGKDLVNAAPLGYGQKQGTQGTIQKLGEDIIEEVSSGIGKAVKGTASQMQQNVQAQMKQVQPPTQAATAAATITTPAVQQVTNQNQQQPFNAAQVQSMTNANQQTANAVNRLAQQQQQAGGNIGGNAAGGGGGGQGGGGGGFGRNGNFDIRQFMNMASPFSPQALSWMMMFGMSGQLQPAAQQLGEPAMMGGEWLKQGTQGTMGFGASFTGVPAFGKLFSQITGTDAFNYYEGLHSSYTVLKNVYRSPEKAESSMGQAIDLARKMPIEVNDLMKIFSTFSVNPMLRGVLSNKEQMNQLSAGVAGLSFLVPEQGTQGASFAIREALSGNFRSLRMRFNIDPNLIASAGGMSMSEMQQKPTNFLGALSSFLKSNLGENTFMELQSMFSKQVGNIFDSLVGGIFKSFRSTSIYESASSFAGQLTTTTSDLFSSDIFGDFFKKFGAGVSGQFTKARQTLKSMDFQNDSGDVLTEKFTKAVTYITKDMMDVASPALDKVIEVAGPSAKKVGQMVSNYLSKGITTIVGGAIGMGASSIVETLESGILGVTDYIPGVGKGLRAAHEAVLPSQRDFITEHPLMTIAAGYMAQKPMVSFLSNLQNGPGGFAGAAAGAWENSSILKAIGMGGAGSFWKAVPLLAGAVGGAYAYNRISGAMGMQTNEEEAREKRYQAWRSGKSDFADYEGIAFTEALGGNTKNEKSGILGSALSGIMGGIGVAGMIRSMGQNPNSRINQWLNASPFTPNFRQGIGQTGEFIAGNMLYGPNGTHPGFKASGFAPITELSSEIPATFGQQLKGMREKAGNAVRNWAWKETEQVTEAMVPKETPKEKGGGVAPMPYGMPQPQKRIVERISETPTTEGVIRTTERSEEAIKGAGRTPLGKFARGAGIAAGVGIMGASLLSDLLVPEYSPLSAKDRRNQQVMTGIGQGLTAAGGAVAMFNPLIGGAMMLGGMGVETLSKVGFGRGWFTNQEEQKARDEKAAKRLTEVNASITGASNTIMNSNFGNVNDIGELDRMQQVMGMDLQKSFNDKMQEFTSTGRVSDEVGKKLSTNIPKAAQKAVAQHVNVTADNIKKYLVESGYATEEELKNFTSPGDMQALFQSFEMSRANYIKQTRPDEMKRFEQRRKSLIQREIMTTPELAGSLEEYNAKDIETGLNLQDTVTQKRDTMGQMYNALEKRIATQRFEKMGGKETYEQSANVARGMVDEIKSKYDVEGAFTRIQGYLTPYDTFMKDKVLNFKQQGRDIFNSDWMTQPGGIQQTMKSYGTVLSDTMTKQMMFGIAAPKSVQDQWKAQGLTGEALASAQKQYVSTVPAAFGLVQPQISGMLSGDLNGKLLGYKMGAARENWNATVADFESIPQRAAAGTDAWVNQIKAPNEEVYSRSLDKSRKIGSDLMKNVMDNLNKGMQEKNDLNAGDQGFTPVLKTLGEGGGLSKDKADEARKKLEEAVKNSRGDTDAMMDSIKRIGDQYGMEYTGNKGELESFAKAYDLNAKKQSMFENPIPQPNISNLVNEQFGAVAQRNMSAESVAKLGASAVQLTENWKGLFGGMSGAYNYGAQSFDQMMTGQMYAAPGASQQYGMINGKMMPTNFNVAGQTFENMWYKKEVAEQRQRNAVPAGQLAELNQMGGQQAIQAKGRVSTVVGALEKMGASGQLSQESMQMLDQVMGMAKESGADLGGDLIGRSMKLKKQWLGQQGNAFDENVMPAFLRGDTEALNAFGRTQMGADYLKNKEGKSPMAEAAGMSGFAQNLTDLAAAAQAATQALTAMADTQVSQPRTTDQNLERPVAGP